MLARTQEIVVHPRYQALSPERLAARLAEDVVHLTPSQHAELARFLSERGWAAALAHPSTSSPG